MYVLFPAEEIVLGTRHTRNPAQYAQRHHSLCRYHRQLLDQQQSQQSQQSQPPLQDDILDALARASSGAREPSPRPSPPSQPSRPPPSPISPRGVAAPSLQPSGPPGRADRSPRSSPRSSSSSRSRAAGSALALFDAGLAGLPGVRSPSPSPPQPPARKRRAFFGPLGPLGPLGRALKPQSAPATPSHSPRLGRPGPPGQRPRRGPPGSDPAMAGSDLTLRELTHPQYNEPLQKHNSLTFRLVRTVSDFTTELSQLYERHAEELQMLVAGYRKRNAELRKDRGACQTSLFQTWDILLQEVEKDSQAHSDIASVLGRQVARPLLEKTFHRKIQSRKVFGTREAYEQFVAKTEEKLVKARQDYKNAYMSYMASPNTAALASYFDAHNAYVAQLHATNGILEHFGTDTLPALMQELEDIYADLCATMTDAALQGAEVISSRAQEQQRRYDGLATVCRSASAQMDIVQVVKALAPQGAHPHPPTRRHFAAPHVPPPEDSAGGDLGNTMLPPALKNELVTDRLASIQIRAQLEGLRKEGQDLELQCKQLQDALDTLHRMQQRSLESALYNKANELQDEISVKKYDLRVAQMQLAAVRAQRELFGAKVESASDGSGRERKMSSSSTGSMKSKWLKAFKSLKTTGSSSSSGSNAAAQSANPARESERKNGRDAGLSSVEIGVHDFQEYTYKKITPCDVCSQVLRGHARQGVKCRLCKMNVHVDCKERVGRCSAKGRLLRRQKSSSEIESRLNQDQREDERLLRARITTSMPFSLAGSAQGAQGAQRAQQAAVGAAGLPPTPDAARRRRRWFAGIKSLSTVAHHRSRGESPGPGSRSISLPETPHSPRRQKLNLRMKSLSLDSPESTEHARRGRPGNSHGHQGGTSSAGSGPHDPHSSHSSSSRLQSPSSPGHARRHLSARNMRMSSVELPDDNDKSQSSASTSPCPSPVRDSRVPSGQKPHRLLPTNLYVVLFNFKARHQDELDLKAGYKVTVIDTTDMDWWKGKCLGRIGFFPSKYVTKIQPGERPLQVTHNLQVADGEDGLTLLRDQIVIQVGEELDGMVMIRSGDNRQGVCPLKFLQEV